MGTKSVIPIYEWAQIAPFQGHFDPWGGLWRNLYSRKSSQTKTFIYMSSKSKNRVYKNWALL